MRIYLFGPMRGYEDFNFAAFKAAQEKLESLGHEVFSPAERDLKAGFDPRGRGTDAELAKKAFDLREALAEDLEWICLRAQALVGLEGWPASAGSLAEVHTAKALGIPVFELEDFLGESI
jgi:hypothetical protein